MGRTACGVRGIRLESGQQVVSLIVASEGDVLTVTENGYGKRTPIDQYPVHGRGGQGVISIQTSERNGSVVGAVQVTEEDEVMMISDGGTLVRNRVAEISQMGRNTQGVIMIRLYKQERLIGIERVESLDGEGDEDESESETDPSSEDN
jgi:DNA gyrase subunit A